MKLDLLALVAIQIDAFALPLPCAEQLHFEVVRASVTDSQHAMTSLRARCATYASWRPADAGGRLHDWYNLVAQIECN